LNAVRIRRKLESETPYLPELKPLIGKNVEIIVEEKHPDDPGCFAELSAPKPLSEKETQALRQLLTADQFEALNDIASRGGPDVEAIARLRSKSMT
jgi:hypothetical protein